MNVTFSAALNTCNYKEYRFLHMFFFLFFLFSGHTKIGYALYFYSYSSWSGRAVYMEDLYVMPEFRGTKHLWPGEKKAFCVCRRF